MISTYSTYGSSSVEETHQRSLTSLANWTPGCPAAEKLNGEEGGDDDASSGDDEDMTDGIHEEGLSGSEEGDDEEEDAEG